MDFSAWVWKAAGRSSAQLLLAGHSHVQSGVIRMLLQGQTGDKEDHGVTERLFSFL